MAQQKKSHDRSEIETCRKMLTDLRSSRLSTRQLIVALAGDITDAVASGVTYVDIAKSFSDRGINVSAGSIKTYVSAANIVKSDAGIAKESGSPQQTA